MVQSSIGSLHETESPAARLRRSRLAFTIVELLVVISIISILVALTMPALSAARESARMIACKSNLKQLYIGLSAFADSKGAYCSGAFDWKRDGAVTEVGWVADVVNNGILAGKMLCPSNADYINCTYDTLLNETDVSTFSCLSKKSGSPAGTNPDGSAKVNPCRKLLGDYPASSGPMTADEARRAFVEEAIYNRGYNTNYAASWFLVRTAVTLDAHGNLRNSGSSSCAPLSPMERHCTIGPLNRVRADASKVPSNLIPFLGDAAPTGKFLSAQVGNHSAGAPMLHSFTHGPISKSNLEVPSFPASTTYEGANGWWVGWKAALQDYRQFGTPHKGSCNLVFADGSVRDYRDTNRDEVLNDGFPAGNGFNDDTVELPSHDVFCGWQLMHEDP